MSKIAEVQKITRAKITTFTVLGTEKSQPKKKKKSDLTFASDSAALNMRSCVYRWKVVRGNSW